jgi:UDP-3-O-[3-hydroxymyristoyl] glucosamine N-acyltransferase
MVSGHVKIVSDSATAVVRAHTDKMKLHELARRLGCTVASDSDPEITGVAAMEQAGPDQITFLANPKYAHRVKSTSAGAILVAQPVESPAINVISANPYVDFARALALFYQPPRPEPGIDPRAAIHPTASIGENASVGAFAVVGPRTRIGRNAVIHPHVVIYEGAEIGDDFVAHSHASVREYCQIGHRVTLQNGVVVGGDGFGFARRHDGSHEKIVQSGITVIDDDVELQTLTSVDRATVGQTRIRRGAKIDSLVQIGHACVVGEDNIVCAQTGLAGSSVLGRNVLLAGQVGVSGHLTIHDNTVVYAQSGVGGDVAAGSCISGSPAFDSKDWLRSVTVFPRLPELLRAMRQLERRVKDLEASRGE